MRTLRAAASIALIACWTQNLEAQVHVYHHSATPDEAFLRGWADLINCSGLYNLNSAQAFEICAAACRENQRFAVSERQRLAAEYQAKRKKKAEKGAAWAAKLRERANESGKLVPEYRQTSQIAWPKCLLMGDPQIKARVECLVAKQRYEPERFSASDRAELQACVRTMQRSLRELTKQLPAAQHSAATRFLNELLAIVSAARRSAA